MVQCNLIPHYPWTSEQFGDAVDQEAGPRQASGAPEALAAPAEPLPGASAKSPRHGLNLCTYVDIYIYVCMYICIDMYVYMYTYIYKYTCIDIDRYLFIVFGEHPQLVVIAFPTLLFRF